MQYRQLLIPFSLGGMLFSAQLSADSLTSVFDSYSQGSAGTYQSKSATHFYGGNVTARINQPAPKNLVGFTPPSYKAGCGGIDIYGGSFSLISGDEVVQMARGIAQGAAPYFFNLAVSSICASCGVTLQNLSDRLNELNQFAKTSCENFYAELDKKTEWTDRAQQASLVKGVALDQSLGMQNWVSSVMDYAPNKSALSAGTQEKFTSNIMFSVFDNVIALESDSGWANTIFSSRLELIQIMMDITGTAIADFEPVQGQSYKEITFTNYPATLDPLEWMYGKKDNQAEYSYKRIRCSESLAADPKCLKVVATASTEQALNSKYLGYLTGSAGIFKRLKTKSTMEEPQIKFMREVDFPYVWIAVKTEDSQLDTVGKYIAMRAAFERVRSLYSMTYHYLLVSKTMDWENRNAYIPRINAAITLVANQLKKIQDEYDNQRKAFVMDTATLRAATSSDAVIVGE